MTRPNFLIFMPDQLRFDAVGAFGSLAAKTPNIDALARRGSRFDNAWGNFPVCGPSRTNLMTGVYSHDNGHRTQTNLVKPWEPNLLRTLKDAGYNVAWAGHRGDTFAPGVTEDSTSFCGWLVEPEVAIGAGAPPQPEGSKLWSAMYNGRRPPVLDFDEAAVRTAERWLEDGPTEPWVLFVALVFPHPPFEVEDPWYSLHDPADMPKGVPPMAGKPRYHEALREQYGLDRMGPDDWAEVARTYYGMVSRVDDQLGRVQVAVEKQGVTGRTVTIFLSDHGEYLGDFGLVEKWWSGLDRCLCQNPLIVAAPGGKEDHVVSAPVETVDLLPTILDLAEVEPSHPCAGRSFAPLLLGESAELRDATFTEAGWDPRDEPLFERGGRKFYAVKASLFHEDPDLVGRAVAVRTATHTYVYRQCEGPELYDRLADPQETTNLAGRPGTSELERALRDRILDWLLTTTGRIPSELDPRFPEIPHGYR